jgi:putative ABC transport system permease protein
MGLLSTEKDNFWEKGLAGDYHFFEVFAIPFIQGNPTLALKDATSIILTKSLAEKIFPNEDPFGQSLKYQNGEMFVVSGINRGSSSQILHCSIPTSLISSLITGTRKICNDQNGITQRPNILSP